LTFSSYDPTTNSTTSTTNSQASLELTFLGTGSAFTIDGKYWGSILVNNNILLDCSPIVVPHFKKLGLDLTMIEHIFITHFHGDHYLGLPFLLLDYAYLTAPKKPLIIIGPSGIKDKVTHVSELAFSGLFEKLRDKIELEYLELSGPGVYSTIGNQRFEAHSMSHGTHPSYGYKLTVGNKTLAYTGDTDLCQGVSDLAADADILIIELSNPDKDVPGHMSLEKLARLHEQLSPDLKIILNHVGHIPSESTELLNEENILLPNDLDKFRF
jgi:ribonuclease BN (tRNA processing enzyme)